MKLITLLSVLFLFLFSFGCISSQSDAQTYAQLGDLQEKYLMKENYSSNRAALNDYISKLSILRTKATGESQKVIDAELNSVQTFFHLNEALAESAKINYQSIQCSSVEVKATREHIKMALSFSQKAISVINSLSAEEKSKLKPNLSEVIIGYTDTINQINSFFEQKC